MKRVEIPVSFGDGVGPELMDAVLVLFSALQKRTGNEIITLPCPVGGECFRKCGESLPAESLRIMQEHSATLMTALDSKACPPPSPMGKLRKTLGLYADIRHCVSAVGSKEAPVDIVVFRECSEDFLPDRNMYLGTGEFMPTPDVALSVRVTTRDKCAQIARDAFEFARKNKRNKVTVVQKRVVFRMNCGMFMEEAEKKAAEYPEIAFESEAPDHLAGSLVMYPERYDIILAASLFGDIISDVAAAKVGNMMRIINSNGKNALFYPSHGAQYEYVGTGRISPITMFYTAADLLSWVGLEEEARILGAALDQTTSELSLTQLILPENIRTADVTSKVEQAILSPSIK